MDKTAKTSAEATYRKVYLADLRTILDIYQDKSEKLTEHFGLPLAIAEYRNDVIGFASAKLNESEEVEVSYYYKNGITHSEIQPLLEKSARNTFNSTFDNNPESGKKLKLAVQRLIDWLNNCS